MIAVHVEIALAGTGNFSIKCLDAEKFAEGAESFYRGCR